MWGLLEDALKRRFAPLLECLWQSVTFWRAIALISLVLLFTAWALRNPIRVLLLRSKRTEHDTGIFERSDALMPEQALSACLTSLWNANEYSYEHRDQLMAFQEFFEQAGNQYLTRRLSRGLVPLTDALKDLLPFTAKHFFTHPNPGVDRFCLYPEYRNSLHADNERIYQSHAEERRCPIFR